jgi:hypothetical protein
MKMLEYLAGITDDECDRLRKLGVLHTNQLIHATTLVIDRERIERRTGIPVERLYYLGQQASLMEISGLTRHLRVVMRLGITTLRQLGTAEPAELYGKLIEVLGVNAPTLSEVEYWVSQAPPIDVVEDPEETVEKRVRRYVPS